MSFIESPRFPEGIAMGAVGGPSFLTDIAQARSGRESRNAAWQYPRHEWDVAPGVRTQAQFLELRAYFMAARGRKRSWRLKDSSDFECTVAEGVVEAITSTTFQLFKRYSVGAEYMDRRIRKPVSGTVTMFVSAVAATFTVDYTTGIATIAAAPDPATVTWAGQFDVPMRFDTDSFEASKMSRDSSGLVHMVQRLPVVEDMAA